MLLCGLLLMLRLGCCRPAEGSHEAVLAADEVGRKAR